VTPGRFGPITVEPGIASSKDQPKGFPAGGLDGVPGPIDARVGAHNWQETT